MTSRSTIMDILQDEYIAPGTRVKTVCEDISRRHEGRVLALIYYGSSLREMDNPEKMLDFYVIVDSYRKTHKNPFRVLANSLIPPAVYYHELLHDDGIMTRCKYSIMSIKAFERRCSKRAFLSMTWGRFSQPCIVLSPRDKKIEIRLQTARENAIRHMAGQTTPLFSEPVTTTEFWARGFRESYRTELRPEKAEDRSAEIVERYLERYDALSDIILGPKADSGLRTIPEDIGSQRVWCKTKWFLRRLIGKPVGAVRVINSAVTFDGGLDYIMRKLEDHSSVRIEVTDHQRRHPILWSPVLAFKYYKRGAFR